MSRDEKNGGARLDRRTLLRGAAAGALAAPLGVFGAQAFPFRAATPGIDALFLGPADLSIALSNGADVDPMSLQVDRELDRIMGAAHKAGKVMGAYCHSAERAAALAKRGVRFLAVGSDMSFLRAGAAAAIKALKS